MKRFRIVLAAVLVAAVGFTTTLAATFDGDPPAPQPFTQLNQTEFDVQVHSRDNWTWAELETQAAHHGNDCSPPPGTHTTSGSYDDAVFLCKNHLMTALNATGYGVIYLTPNTLADWSGGETVIRWDMSTLRTSDRDWVDVWVTPWADNMALPLEGWLPDLTGEPTNAVHVRMDNNGSADPLSARFRLMVIENGQETDYGLGANYNGWLTQDAARRDTFELRITPNRVTLTMPGYGQTIFDRTLDNTLDFASGVVQFGHHSYNPTKGYAPNARADTWHWDNITVSPSIPFTMIKGNTRRVSSGGSVTFTAPAPAASMLRFSAQGRVEVNFGSGYSVVQPQQPNDDGFHFASYFVPIPAGAQTVTVRMTKGSGQWYTGPFWAKDFAVWTLGAPGPTSTPPNTPTATNTPLPTNTPTVTPTPTSTPLPTATPQPRYRCQVRQGNSWVTVWDHAGGGSCP